MPNRPYLPWIFFSRMLKALRNANDIGLRSTLNIKRNLWQGRLSDYPRSSAQRVGVGLQARSNPFSNKSLINTFFLSFLFFFFFFSLLARPPPPPLPF